MHEQDGYRVNSNQPGSPVQNMSQPCHCEKSWSQMQGEESRTDLDLTKHLNYQADVREKTNVGKRHKDKQTTSRRR